MVYCSEIDGMQQPLTVLSYRQPVSTCRFYCRCQGNAALYINISFTFHFRRTNVLAFKDSSSSTASVEAPDLA